ncbi:MAG: hypothetical protein D6786_01895, partial [Gammaproteobacteria bacterium]
LNLAAGLEDDIVRELAPPWNISGNRKSATRKNAAGEGRKASEPAGPPEVKPTADSPPAAPAGLRPHFDLTLGRTYYGKGFFNVPVDCERYFGRHGESVAIHCEGRAGAIHGRIDRKANPQTHAPRIFGGAALRDWIQSRFRPGERVRVVIDDPRNIRMLKH